LTEWQTSVVSIWTPTAHASGFVIDASGLVVTSRRALGSATPVEVQLTRTVKVPATVVTSSAASEVAVVRIDPAIAATARSIPLGCTQTPQPRVAVGQKIFSIGALPLQPNDMTSGTVSRVDAHVITSNLLVPAGSEGGPVFSADGVVVGISSVAADPDARTRADARVVTIDDACAAVASADKAVTGTPPPGGAQLPVEPLRLARTDAPKKDEQQHAIAVAPYQLSSSDFDVTFITPPLLDAARSQMDQAIHRERSGGVRGSGDGYGVPRQLIDFGNWSDYVSVAPPVLLVRATPRLVEGFWTKVARGAAMTQGMAVPPIPHLASGFSRMRMLCGDREVGPIHPFRIESRISDTETISEGLYVFDPDALAPSCASVTVALYSQKQPEKADTRVVDAKLVQRIRDDFASSRAPR
jgi:hypothetical protein